MAVERVVDAFLDHLTVERGASVHTVAGYRRDLSRYAAFLAGRGITELSDAGRADVAAFAEDLRSGEGEHAALAASSVARALSAVKSLHRFAVDDGAVVDNAAAGVSPPQAGRRLPKALSLAQVQALLDSPDTTTPAGLRDAALLELLYGTGARISELTDLDVDDVSGLSADPEAGLRLFGKGRKERLVPVGSYARSALDAWLVRGRPAMLERAREALPRCSSTPGEPGSAGNPPGRCCASTPNGPGSPPRLAHTPCGTRSPPTCWTVAPTSASCRNCSGTPRWPPPRSTPWSPWNTSARSS